MKFGSIVAAIGCGVFLTACQTVEYQRIGYGPELDYSLAQCELGAMSTERGMFAMGSASYVMGAQLGNAISNEIRKAEFVKRCMILNGWGQVTPGQRAQPQARPQPTAAKSTNRGYQPRQDDRAARMMAQPPMAPKTSSYRGGVATGI